MNTYSTTLADFLAQTLPADAHGRNLNLLLQNIANITVAIAALVARGALADATGKLSSQNVQGETQMKLDVLTNDAFIESLSKSGLVAGLASEEMDLPINLAGEDNQHKFLVIFDPLDGSSNVPVNVSIGSIFSVLDAVAGRAAIDSDYLQAGKQQVAAGYAIYGPSTMLVLSTGQGTHAFTLDPESKQFVLTQHAIQLPEMTTEYAINASNERHWESPVLRYVDECKAGVRGARERDFNMRWVASMVADVHRILMRGGVYLYPRDNKQPIKAGRLRLMYEANPMSMLVEQAGGKSSTGRQRIMDIVPEQIHQRVPVVIGSAQEVRLIDWYHQQFDSGEALKGQSPLFGERSLFQKTQ